jgi:hypothetical protein
MELDYAMLADAAQVAEGKTFILGGGITILWRNQYPAPIACTLVMYLTHHRAESGTEHHLAIRFTDADGNPVLPELRADIGVGEAPPHLPTNVTLGAPVVIPFPPIPVLQRPGSYAIEILIDDRHVKSIPVAVAHPPQQNG